MNSFPSILAALGAMFVAPRVAAAAEFVPNHLFVVDRATAAIRELDPFGNVVRTFGNGVLLDPQAMAFGPDGSLYVLDDRASEPSFDLVFVFSPEGDTLDQLAVAPEASFDAAGAALCVAGRGRFLVGDAIGPEFHEYEPGTGILATFSSSSFADSVRPILGPAGRIYAATGGDPTSVLEFDAAGVEIAASAAASTGIAAPPALIARDGAGRIVKLDRPAAGTGGTLGIAFPTDAPPPLVLTQGPFVDLSCGPDGRIWILAEGGSSLLRVEPDLSSVEELPYLPALEGAAMAFAPFRFRASVAGKRIDDGANTKTYTEKRVFLTLFPGAARAFVEFDDDEDVDHDVASLFAPGALAFAGHRYREKDGETERIHATRVERTATVDLVAQATLRLRGATSAASGYFRVIEPRGEIVISRGGVAFTGKIESAKLLD